MNCKKAQRLMSAYVDNMLSESEKNSFELHISGCESCKKELELIKETAALSAGLKFAAPENFTKEVCEKINSVSEENVSKEERGFAVPFKKYGTVFAAFVILAAVAFANPVWEEYKNRTAKSGISTNETSKDGGESAYTKNSTASDVVKTETGTADNADKNTVNDKQTDKALISGEKEEINNGSNTKKNAEIKHNISENTDLQTSPERSVPNSENADNENADNENLRVFSVYGEDAENKTSAPDERNAKSKTDCADTDAEPFSATLFIGESSAADDPAQDAPSSKRASGGSGNFYDIVKISVQSHLDLAETESIISEILGFEVMGSNGEIELLLTNEEFAKLADSLKDDADFEGFDVDFGKNDVEILIFTK